MRSKLPIISSPVRYGELLDCARRMRDNSAPRNFATALKAFTGSGHVYLTNSGISSFYLILKAISRIAARRDVILPAYTAGSLVVAVRKAGLKPALCDISLKDFNLDIASLPGKITRDTLAVTCVHTFGVNIGDIGGLRKKIPGNVFMIEDCAQSMGSRTGGVESGAAGDIAFYSFNRGKNLPLYGGGFISTKDERIASAIGEEADALAGEGIFYSLSALVKILAFSIAANPAIYGPAFRLISRFKETKPPRDFAVRKMSNLHAGLGLALLKRREELFSQRYRNGLSVIEGLRGIDGIILPGVPADSRFAFNRLPVLFKETDRMELAARKLWEAGVETSGMYMRPLHHMFDLGYGRDEFPNAVYCARRLLALPTHPLVDDRAAARMVKVIKEVMT